MEVNELKKGDRVLLRNGWEADIADNKRNGTTRLAKVYGFETEIGSVYSHDITAVKAADGLNWTAVSYSPAQRKLARELYLMGL